jgi:4-hydroxy-tetrahydrodipicolinate synthase
MKLEGIWPALLTPLNDDLSIDIDTFANHAKNLLKSGCRGITPFGTTGEGPSFSVEERIAAIDGLIARGIKADRILVSTSAAALTDVLTLTKHAVSVGAFGCLIMPPFFLKNVPQQGVIDFFSYIIEQTRLQKASSQLRVVLYHIPQIAGVGLSHPVVANLKSRYPETIIGIKDSSGNREGSVAFSRAFSPSLQVWVGNEPDLQTMASMGSLGAVSGVANVMPKLLQRLTNGPGLIESHFPPEQDAARVKTFIDILNGYVMTSAFKGVMALKHKAPGWKRVRPPLVALTNDEMTQLSEQIAKFSLDSQKD